MRGVAHADSKITISGGKAFSGTEFIETEAGRCERLERGPVGPQRLQRGAQTRADTSTKRSD